MGLAASCTIGVWRRPQTTKAAVVAAFVVGSNRRSRRGQDTVSCRLQGTASVCPAVQAACLSAALPLVDIADDGRVSVKDSAGADVGQSLGVEAMCSRICAALFIVFFALTQPSLAATIRRVAGPGDPVPGVPGATFDHVDFSPSFDHLGDLRISATIAGAGVTWRNDRGLWLGNDRTLRLVLRHEDLLPGATSGEYIKNRFVVGNLQDWGFFELSGPHVDATNNQALIGFASGVPRTVAQRDSKRREWHWAQDFLRLMIIHPAA